MRPISEAAYAAYLDFRLDAHLRDGILGGIFGQARPEHRHFQ